MGDNFVAKSMGPYFQNNYLLNSSEGYISQHYDTTVICSGSISKDLMNSNLIGRLYNNFVATVHEQVLLPKAVIIILEEDLLKSANHFKKGLSNFMHPCMDWIVSNLFRITTAYKEKLPSKSRRFKYPQFFWVPAVLHDDFNSGNRYREKFNDVLEEAVEKTRGVQLRLPTWNRHDLSLTAFGSLNEKRLEKILGSDQ